MLFAFPSIAYKNLLLAYCLTITGIKGIEINVVTHLISMDRINLPTLGYFCYASISISY